MSNALLGNYRLEHCIGSGTHGDVYKATNLFTGLLYALKRVPFQQGILPREFQILKSVKSCPQCVNLYDSFIAKSIRGNVLCMVLEYLPMNLMEFLGQQNVEKYSMSLYILEEILKGLSFLHSKGIVHRDLKPENILINPYVFPVQVKIADFGSSKFLKIRNSPFVVTRFYRAPELIFGSSRYDSSIDIWAAACIFIELLISTPLFPAKSDGALFFDQISKLGIPPPHIISKFKKISDKCRILEEIENLCCPILVSNYLPSIVLDSSILRLIKSMLQWEYSLRPSAEACLKILYLTK